MTNINDLNWLPPHQRQLVLQCRHPGGQVAEITMAEVGLSVSARFAKMVVGNADRIAFASLAHSLTYAELDAAANQIARGLLRRRRAACPVAMMMDRARWPLAAVHGTAKVGMPFVALPPDNPIERLSYILQDLGDPLFLADAQSLDLATQLVGDPASIVVVEECLARESTAAVDVEVTGSTPYMIRYTSGSTGQPKGVLNLHDDFLHHARNRIAMGQYCPADRIASLGNNVFGAVITTLLGASHYDFDLRKNGAPVLAQALADHEITVFNSTTTGFRQLVRSADGLYSFPHIRYVMLRSEPPTPEDIRAASRVFTPACVFSNQYGTTEAYMISTFYVTTATAAHLASWPAGYALPGTEILLLDEHGQPVADGEIGEIAARNRYLSRGYWQRPELTQERFRRDPDGGDRITYLTGDLGRRDPDGCLHHMGRKDWQVKIRAHRVEITAVEAALRSVPGVTDAAVVAHPGPGGDLRLVAYVAFSGQRTTVSSLRHALGQRLPLAMVPAQYVFLDRLPMTPSHKVDRRALPAPGHARPELDAPYAAPRTPVEEELTRIWAEVLGLDTVGIGDDFLELGGDSLLASQVITRVIRELRVSLALSVLYAAPTVAEMALAVTQEHARMASPVEIEELLAQVAASGGA